MNGSPIHFLRIDSSKQFFLKNHLKSDSSVILGCDVIMPSRGAMLWLVPSVYQLYFLLFLFM